MSGERIVVTGSGAVSCFGPGAGLFFSSLLEGRCGIREIDRWDVSEVDCRQAALVRGDDPFTAAPSGLLRRLDLASRYALGAAQEALRTARLPSGSLPPDRIGVCAGTNSAGTLPVRDFLRGFWRDGMEGASPMLFPFALPNAPASQAALLLDLRGPNITVCQKEASGLAAVSQAMDLLAGGSADAVLAGGAEDHNEVLHEAYDRLAVLSSTRDPASRPFDRSRDGFIAGEGAFFAVLERASGALQRGAAPLAEVASVAVSHAPCGLHDWPSDPAPLADAMRRAMESADTRPAGIDWICSSANSTLTLDRAEREAIGELFGHRRRPVEVSSLKGAIGEFGAVGGAQVIAACAAIRSGAIPPTCGTADPEEPLGFDLVRGRARRCVLDAVLVNSFASGGCLVSMVLRRVL